MQNSLAKSIMHVAVVVSYLKLQFTQFANHTMSDYKHLQGTQVATLKKFINLYLAVAIAI